jgi:hypothetical protein
MLLCEKWRAQGWLPREDGNYEKVVTTWNGRQVRIVKCPATGQVISKSRVGGAGTDELEWNSGKWEQFP